MKRVEFDEQAYAQRSRTGPCFICRMLAGDPEFRHEIVYRDEHHVVFLDRYPTLLGKLLVAPVLHREDVIGDFTEEETAELWQTVHRAGAALKHIVPTERIYVLSLGSKSGNSHVHIHVAALPPGVPYEEQQTASLLWESAGLLEVSAEETARIAGQLRASLSSGEEQHAGIRDEEPVPASTEQSSSAPPRHQEPVDVHLILRRDGAAGPEVLLSRRAGQVYASGLLHLPSGHLDGSHEDVVEALIREAKEETGVDIDPADVRAAVTVHHRSPAGGSRIGIFFEVRRWHGAPRIMEPAVCDAMGWYPLDDLPSPMVAYCRAGLDAYRTGRQFAVHFRRPGDPIAFDPTADCLRSLLSAEPAADAPHREVREFTEKAVGRVSTWTDTSWAREGSRVWLARGAEGGEWFVKVHQSDRFHGREVEAYRTWVPALGPAAPRLVAADARLRAVVITAMPGRSLHGALHPPEEQRRIFHRIGVLAAAIHRSAPPRPGDGAPAALGKLERHLAGARNHLAPGDEDYIRAMAKRAEQLPALDLVPTHGDFQLRNLRWDEATGSLCVIDFERAEPGPAVRDFVRLSDAWTGRPDLYEAVMAGYGRQLSVAEEEHLTVHQVLDAVSGIQYGAANGDPELVERGRRTLAKLRATNRP
ncbi:phosphotransferase [Kitasatospora kifunensis]|uniref:Diadenosine tetraphosphate (Ap4A) HIT family hydrolase/ADP-ribose pyrophosphatase YjhB (NUDIX family) n=1 Tax=Kitasatospora kifunensis TaxID=58351 RepID=A0A7W7W0B6_KITKI|nr:phosphotransferase [Kitasatospora kifunensis]MBB4928589.1 diadenosine tetraphosphate (Ap4A) HIT family hydrolase/ADP-ribose pyrophosphatase YjhB (NUDIX family) [Kitasatospora kifunensis]